MLKRGFSLLLSIVMAFSALPLTAVAEENSPEEIVQPAAETASAPETAPEGDISLQDAEQDNYGNYTFTTFADLQTLAAGSYIRTTYARYTGEGALTVSADLTLPKYLHLTFGAANSAIIIDEEATLATTDSTNAITVDSLEINGTLSSRGYLLVEEELTVNGTFEYYTDVYLNADALLHRNGTLRSMNTGADLIRTCDVFSLEELKTVAAAAEQDQGVLYVINLDAYGAGDLELQEDLVVPANVELTIYGDGSLTIPEDCTLELNCSRAALYINTNVSGTLKVNAEASLEDAVITFAETGSLSGSGVLNVYLGGTDSLEDVVIGLNMDSVQATEYNTAGQHYWILKPTAGLTKLGMPADLTWNTAWNPETQTLDTRIGFVSWKAAEPWLGTAVVRLYREGGSAYIYSHRYESEDLTAGQWHSLDLFALAEPESGTYYFTVQAETDAEGYCSSDAAVSDTFVYTKSVNALDACSDLSWDWPTAVWTAPAGAAACEVEFLYAKTADAEPDVIGSDTAAGGSLRIPNEAVQLSGAGYYYFRVRALSSDLSQAANGPWSERSEAYVLDALIQGVETELNYIAENLTEPDEIRDAVQAMDTESLKEAMTADGSAVIDTLAAVEQTAGGSAAVRVEETVTAFDADKISVIGANLHTPENAESPIALVIGAPKRETSLDTVYDSDAAVAISMTLENAGVEDILAVPVEITLPVPAHLNVEYLVVLHYLYDGSLELPELEVFRQDDQWYVSFVVTSLGDFVLTQYAETIAARGTSGSISWQLSSWGNLNISGTGAMTDYESAKGTPWAIYSADICAVIVEEGVTHVGAFAFCGCENLETVTLASTVETIGEAAFVCSGITEFRVAEESTILTAQDGILYSADMTALIAYPGGKTDAVYALPETVAAIGPFAVNNNVYLTEMILPEGLETIGQWAFGDCYALTTVTIPAAVTAIGEYAFEECSALTDIRFKGEAPAIAEYAFDCVTANAWYPAILESWTEDTMLNYGGELTWKAVLIPEDAVLTLSEEYIALNNGESAQLHAAILPAELDDLIRWSTGDEAVASVDDNGYVTANGEGTTYVTATVNDGNMELTARCRVDVADPIVLEDVQLSTTKLTTELFSTDYAVFDLLLVLPQNVSLMSAGEAYMPDSNSVAIEDVCFTASTTKVAFDLVALDDCRIAVVPTEYAVDYPDELAKTYKSTVTVTVDGEEYTTEEELTLTVKKSTPKLKATIPAFNSFCTGQTQDITVTGGTVRNISWNTDKTQPNWLTLNDDGTLSLNENAPKKSASGKAYLLVETEEWRIPAAVTLTVKNTYKAPGLKLSATAATFTREAADSNGVTLKLLPKSKKDSLESLNVTGITAPEGFAITGINREDGSFTLVPTSNVINGKKIQLDVAVAGTNETVPLKLTVKTQTVSLKLSANTVTLNTAVSDSAAVTVTATPADYIIANPTINGNGAGQLDVAFENGILTVRTTEATPADATYKIGISAAGSEAVLTVKTIREVPSVTLKAKGNIDLTYPDQTAAVTATFQKYTNGTIADHTAVVTAPDGTVSDAFAVTREGSIFTIGCNSTEIATGTYVLKLSLKLPNVADPVESTVKFTVKRTAVKLKLTPAKLTLNNTIDDKASVAVTCTTKGYDFAQPIWELMDKTGRNPADGKLDVAWNDGKLNIAVNENTESGAAYKLLVQANKHAPAATLTITILKDSKAKITSSLKAKGSIDVIRDGTAVTITPSCKNCGNETERQEELLIYSSADNYTNPVNHLFRIEQDDQGRYTLTAAEGLDHSKTYKAKLVTRFEGIDPIETKLVKITVKMGTAKLTLKAEGNILFAKDKNSRVNFTLTAKDAALNGVSEVTIKSDKNKFDEKLEIIPYGNGEFAIGFKGEGVHSSLMGKTITVTLNIKVDGNVTAKVNTTAKLKLTILK